jgi:hypothetical protein
MDTDSSPIWNRLFGLARKTKKSLKSAAKAAGVGEGTISGWKIHAPTLDNLVAVAKFYDISLDYLVFGKESMIPGLSPEALEIAMAADNLNSEGKRAALAAVRGLEDAYPLGASKSTGTAT